MMLSNFLSRLKSAFHAMYSESSEHANDSTTFHSSSQFINILKADVLTITRFMNHIVDRIDSGKGSAWAELSGHMVTRLVYYKSTGKDAASAEHESLLATIVDHDGIPSYVLIERLQYDKDRVTDYDGPHSRTTRPLLDRLRAEYRAPRNGTGIPFASVAPASAAPTDDFQISQSSTVFGALIPASLRSSESIDSTAASLPESSGSPFATTDKPATDLLTYLPPTYKPSPPLVALRILEPNNLSLLQLGVIIEGVHHYKRNYHIFESQCYWFAMMVMGVSMLQGGRVQNLEKPKPRGKAAERPWIDIAEYTSAPTDLDDLPIPIPFEVEEQLRKLGGSAGAGRQRYVPFPIVKASFDDIWQVGQESRAHFQQLHQLLNERQSALEMAEERSRLAEEQAAQANARIAELAAEAAEANRLAEERAAQLTAEAAEANRLAEERAAQLTAEVAEANRLAETAKAEAKHWETLYKTQTNTEL